MFFDEKVIVFNVEAKTAEEVIQIGAKALHDKGIVKDTYCENVLKREQTYPTGLMTGEICVAIPHTETEHVNRSQVAFLQLANPVNFKAMDDDTVDVPARLVFMLAMKQAHEQVDTLGKLMGLFGDQELLEQFTKCTSADEFIELVKARGVE